MTDIFSRIKLANGVEMPRLGLGTWFLAEGAETQIAVDAALEVGYRHFDTASAYGNEASLGRALKQSSLKRDQLFITTKLWNSEQGKGTGHRACLDSLERLGLDYIDLYLLHWPVANQTQSAWEDLEKLLDEGLVKSIGVSNFNDKQLETLFKQVNIRPMVNQIELHPYFSRPALVRFCSDRAVVVTAYCPLARGTIKKNQFFQKLGRKHEKTVSQIILRWHYQSGHVLIPKAANPQHIRENASIFDFSLSPDDMAAIGRQNQNRSVLKPPFHFDADGYIIE